MSLLKIYYELTRDRSLLSDLDSSSFLITTPVIAPSEIAAPKVAPVMLLPKDLLLDAEKLAPDKIEQTVLEIAKQDFVPLPRLRMMGLYS